MPQKFNLANHMSTVQQVVPFPRQARHVRPCLSIQSVPEAEIATSVPLCNYKDLEVLGGGNLDEIAKGNGRSNQALRMQFPRNTL